jgi:hypothetical protein
LTGATNVRYDLRVWRAVGQHRGDLVYAREGLLAPWHRIEEPLQPITPYVWSVRARFDVNGETRATEWGSAVLSADWDFGRSSPRAENILQRLYYPFTTPR